MTGDLDQDLYWAGLQETLAAGAVLVTDSGDKPWGQVMLTRQHVVFADAGGEQGADCGPDPHALTLMALGACTAITLRMYAARKGWTIDRIAVRLAFVKPEPGAPRDREAIDRIIELDGALDRKQRERLFAIAEKCPIHQLLTRGAAINSALASP
jgi:putative redox protein